MSGRGIKGAERVPIQSTAGAIPVKNDKGEISMQKVKVKRYVPGKRPDFAPQFSSDEDEEAEGPFVGRRKQHYPTSRLDAEDARIRRLRVRHEDDSDDDEAERIARHRHIHGPEILDEGDDDEEDHEEEDYLTHRSRDFGSRVRDRHREESSEEEEAAEEKEDEGYSRSFREVDRRDQAPSKTYRMEVEESSSDEEELDEEEIERRRAAMRARARQRVQEDIEVMGIEDDNKKEKVDSDEEESSEYEEYTDSEEEDGPRLKPVFVAKKDRVTIQEKEIAAMKEQELEEEAKLKAEARKRETIRMVENDANKVQEPEEDVGTNEPNLLTVNTDDENDEVEYEAWKVRELRRIKRDRDEREQIEKERQETERLRNMTEEERREELRQNPKQITNKQNKGRYKFLQKYYHRGAFYLDDEKEVLKRDVSGATLEDHFDKTVLPKVMQVKNFGRSGRTKYTHLVDQDTTTMESPWANETALSRKFQSSGAGGLKQSFEKPSGRKSRKGDAQ
ncbi:microfibrillar-associated protein 1-like isoform X2 [Strongylocentrotus purpuratus]|uniref:Micro-fibrillar-associated protein 1 C-terminal domain-containing protein n=1 Tax=Strongylocentrotus purpuratus TaxID=7668 RepID=A0A7M7PBJ9_STRPU|nr:microfibrillar-associated protein 1-like isoform X1 [Strongylocentrotus purpuratus]XP_030848960.1 microfibrillar-associated protein 1-like isoform X2 [Strongylocentrotus purpuratus]